MVRRAYAGVLQSSLKILWRLSLEKKNRQNVGDSVTNLFMLSHLTKLEF